MVLTYSFVKPKMVSKWQITINGGLGELFELLSLVCKTGARRSISLSLSLSLSCGDVLCKNLHYKCIVIF